MYIEAFSLPRIFYSDTPAAAHTISSKSEISQAFFPPLKIEKERDTSGGSTTTFILWKMYVCEKLRKDERFR